MCNVNKRFSLLTGLRGLGALGVAFLGGRVCLGGAGFLGFGGGGGGTGEVTVSESSPKNLTSSVFIPCKE